MPNVVEPITTSGETGLVLESLSLVGGGAELAQSVSTISGDVSSLTGDVGSLDERVTAVEAGGSGGSDPDVSHGPYRASTITSLTKITELTPIALGIAAGFEAVVAVRLKGTTEAAGLGLCRDVRVSVTNLAGTLSTLLFAAGADITSGSYQEALTGWDSEIRISEDGTVIEVLALTTAASSLWRVMAWVSSLAPIATTGLTDEAPEVTLTAPNATSVDVPVSWVRTLGITGVFASQNGTLPGTPTWETTPPATVTVAGAGPQTIYYWGRTATGTTARRQVTPTVVLDAIAPTITAFVMSDTSEDLTVPVSECTASEPGTWYWNLTGILPSNPTRGAAPTSITFETEGTHTVTVWFWDLAGNLCVAPATQIVVVSTSTDLFLDEFNGSTLAAGWTSVTGASADVTGTGEMRRTDNSGYEILHNMCGGALPAEYYMTWRLPYATLAQFTGLVLQYNPSTQYGVQLFTQNQTGFGAGDGTPLAYDANNFAITTDLGLPANWGTGVAHQITIGVSGTTYNIYFNGQLYGHFTGPAGVSGRGVGCSGQGLNKVFYDCRVSSVLPEYVP